MPTRTCTREGCSTPILTDYDECSRHRRRTNRPPQRSRRTCTRTGCSEPIVDESRYCRAHALAVARRRGELPRLDAVELVRYPDGRGHVSAWPLPGGRARIWPLTVYQAQTTKSAWPRRIYRRAV